MSSGHDLHQVSEAIGGLIAHLAPAETRKLAMQIARDLRRENVKRIKANVEPDGSKMAPRSRARRRVTKAGNVRRTKTMFAKIWKNNHLKAKASTDRASVGFGGEVGRTAAAHHFGARVRKVTLPARQLLGFSPEDEMMILDRVVAHLQFEG